MLQIVKGAERSENSGFRLAPEKERLKNNILPLVLMYFSGVSILLWMTELTGTVLNPVFSIVTIALVPLLCKMQKWWIPVIITVVFAAGTFLFWRQGLYYLLNQIILQYNRVSGREISYFTTGNNTGVQITLCMAFFLAFCVACSCILIQGRHWILMTVMSVLMDVMLLFLLRENSIVYLVFGTMALLGCYVYCQRRESDTRILSGGIIGLSVVCTAAGLIYVNAAHVAPFPQVNRVKEAIVRWMEELQYGKPDYPEGDLNREPVNTEEERFRVTMSKPSLIYLRGYTAAAFSDNRWEKLSYDAYAGEREGMFQAYLRNGFHPLAGLWLYGNVIPQKEEGLCEELTVTVEQVGGSRKYEWIPYGLSLEAVRKSPVVLKDEAVLGQRGTTQKSYKILNYDYEKVLSHKTDELQKGESEEIEAYRSAEADYDKFVKENYGGKEEPSSQGLAELCLKLREDLAKAGWGKNWTSMNYASEGVKELRNCGYSARYVEGYYVDGRNRKEGETILIQSSHAHAWAEVYKAGVGFVPVELTPGYYDNFEVEEEEEMEQETRAVTQAEGLSTDKTEEEEEKNIPWGFYVLVVLLILAGLLIILCGVVLIRSVLIRRRRKTVFADGSQRQKLEMLSSYLLLLFQCARKTEEELPEEYTMLWNKFWFSKEGKLEKEEEKILFDYADEVRKQLFDDSFFVKRVYWKTVKAV